MKSWIADPSRRNSGFEATSKLPSGSRLRRMRSTRRPVPTGTVDLVTTTVRCAGRAAAERLGDLGGGGEDIAQIGMAVAAPRRRADRDEHGVGPGDRRLQLGRETQPAGRDVARHQLVEAGLVDRDLAAPQPLDLAGILVDAGHRDAEFRKTRAGHQADIACTDHRDAHERGLLGFLTVNAAQNGPPLVLIPNLKLVRQADPAVQIDVYCGACVEEEDASPVIPAIVSRTR